MKITRNSKASKLQASGFSKNMIIPAKFVDAQDMHKMHPQTFQVPSEAEIAEIIPGAHAVKISAGGERFWVKVQAKRGENLVGTVCNDLLCTDTHGLLCDDMVEFETRHIYAIEIL